VLLRLAILSEEADIGRKINDQVHMETVMHKELKRDLKHGLDIESDE